MAAYSNIPLDNTLDDIRLLTLHRARNHEDNLHCSLKTYSLGSKTQIPSYDALSYTWGDSSSPQPIRLHIKEGIRKSSSLFLTISNWRKRMSFSVTDNLYRALKRLRSLEHDRILWIDAICIDQTNIAERNHQVLLMSKIYGLANRVIVWLGEYDPEFTIEKSAKHDRGISKDLEPQYYLRLAHELEAEMTGKSKFTELSELDLAPNLWDTQVRLANDAIDYTTPLWFKRAWIIQEYVLAQRYPVFQFGAIELEDSGHEFYRLADQLRCIYLPSYSIKLHMSDLRMIRRDYQQSREVSLAKFHSLLSQCDLKDPRDMVYCLLGMLNPDTANMFKPDYAEPVEICYSKATYAWISADGHLGALAIAARQIGARGTPGLPSWAIDFFKPRKEDAWLGYDARAMEHGSDYGDRMNPEQYGPKYGLMQNGPILNISGIILDEITYTELTYDQVPKFATSKALRWGVTERLPSEHPFKLISRRQDMFHDKGKELDDLSDPDWRVIKAMISWPTPYFRSKLHESSLSNQDDPKTRDWSVFRESRAIFAEAWASAINLHSKKEFLRPGWWWCDRNSSPSVFVTKCGFFGMSSGPFGSNRSEIEERDIILKVPGHTWPLALRKAKNGYYLISHVAVAGLMAGQLDRHFSHLELTGIGLV